MKKFVIIMFMILLFSKSSFADIKDFELEGMSIGDIFSKHYNLETQKKLKKTINDDGTTSTQFTDSTFSIYDEVLVNYSTKSQRIKSIVGILYIPEMQHAKDWMYGENGAIQICLDKQKKITNEIAQMTKSVVHIGDIKEFDWDNSQQKSKYKTDKIVFSKNGLVQITCEDWSSEIVINRNWKDRLTISIIEEKTDVDWSLVDERIIESTEIIETSKKSIFKTNEKFYALLIANSDYEYWEDLKSPLNDVNSISSILENDYGFDVEILKNVNRDTILDKLFEYSNKISDNDNLLIYYAGHGEILNSNAYWIPNNATKEISSKWLNTKDVESAISMINTKDLLVMIDSCYQGTAFKSSSTKVIGPTESEMNDQKYFTKMLNSRSAIVITSGNNEPVVDATIKGHSHFAFKFIDVLKNNNTYETSTNMFVELKKYHANLSQNPNYIRITSWGDLGGDFIFLKK